MAAGSPAPAHWWASRFLTKMLQAFLVLPAFALVYLIAAPTALRRRFLHLLAAFATMIVSLGWWVAIVELTPASLRPYVGGSQSNSVLELIFGYNGLAGSSATAAGGGRAAVLGRRRVVRLAVGITRLFEGVSGGMISWLIPGALVLGASRWPSSAAPPGPTSCGPCCSGPAGWW